MKEFMKPQDLVGEEISAVAFVQDYVEFHFSGPILRCIADPSVICEGAEFTFPERGSRDALCKTIGASIREIALTEDESMRFTTSNGCEVIIPLDESARKAGEAMHLTAGINQPLQVW